MGDAERLACFDNEMAKTSAEARAFTEKRAAEAAVVAKAQAEAAAAKKRDTFGAEAITMRGDRFAPPEGQLQTVETKISEVLTNSSGLAVFMLENGQIWRQVDPSRLPRVRPGDRDLRHPHDDGRLSPQFPADEELGAGEKGAVNPRQPITLSLSKRLPRASASTSSA